MNNEDSGLVVFLNGTSSSGKTTIAKELTRRLYFEYMAIDEYWSHDRNLADQLQQKNVQGILEEATNVVYRFHNSIASRAAVGRNVIVDHVLENSDWTVHCGNTLTPYRVLLVGVYCPIDVAMARESKRGDRPHGVAQYQFPIVHINKSYDLTVDTSVLSPEQCADQIIHAIDQAQYAGRTTHEKFSLYKTPLL